MNRISVIIIFFLTVGCSSGNRTGEQIDLLEYSDNEPKINHEITDVEIAEEINPEIIDLEEFYKKELKFLFTDYKYLTLHEIAFEDLNGDDFKERIEFKRENENPGLIIKDGKSGEETIIGFGNKFAHISDFKWVDYWGILYDKETFEVIIEGSEIIGDRLVELQFPAIILRKEELGGGLIAFENGQYIWIHQSD